MKKGILSMLALIALQALFISGCKKDLSLKKISHSDSDSVAHHVLVSTITTGYYDHVAAGSAGSVYALRSYNGNVIYKVDSSGNKTAFYTPPAPTGLDTAITLLAALTTDSAGNVYTLAYSTLTAKIIKISPAGVATTYIDGLVDYKNAGGIINIKVDGSGDVFFSNYKGIYKMGPGVAATKITAEQVASFDLDNAGNLIVTHDYNVSRITQTGVETNIAGGSPGSNDGPVATATFNIIHELACDNKGNIFVSEVKNGGNNQIRVITNAATVYTLISSADGHVDGPVNTAKIGTPSSLVVNAAGNLYFAEGYGLGSDYIRKITFK